LSLAAKVRRHEAERVKQLQALEKENRRLKKMVAEHALDTEMLMEIFEEAAKGNWQALNVADSRRSSYVAVWGQRRSRSVVRTAFWVNHASISNFSRAERMINKGCYTR
jgi:hypothetical protein